MDTGQIMDTFESIQWHKISNSEIGNQIQCTTRKLPIIEKNSYGETHNTEYFIDRTVFTDAIGLGIETVEIRGIFFYWFLSRPLRNPTINFVTKIQTTIYGVLLSGWPCCYRMQVQDTAAVELWKLSQQSRPYGSILCNVLVSARNCT